VPRRGRAHRRSCSCRRRWWCSPALRRMGPPDSHRCPHSRRCHRLESRWRRWRNRVIGPAAGHRDTARDPSARETGRTVLVAPCPAAGGHGTRSSGPTAPVSLPSEKTQVATTPPSFCRQLRWVGSGYAAGRLAVPMRVRIRTPPATDRSRVRLPVRQQSRRRCDTGLAVGQAASSLTTAGPIAIPMYLHRRSKPVRSSAVTRTAACSSRPSGLRAHNGLRFRARWPLVLRAWGSLEPSTHALAPSPRWTLQRRPVNTHKSLVYWQGGSRP
jgi:hypothetical protein